MCDSAKNPNIKSLPRFLGGDGSNDLLGVHEFPIIVN